MRSAGCRRAGVAGALMATVIAGLGVPSSADAATVAPPVLAGASSEPEVLGDDHGPAPVLRTAAGGVRAGALAVAPAAVPVPGRPLPSRLDAQPGYVGQTSCDPFPKPGAMAFGDLMLATYRTGSYGIARLCFQDGTSEHLEGRAVDWMLSAANPAQHAVATSALAWLTANDGANARRLGVMYLIYNRKMWRAYHPEWGWKAYSGSSPHTDHIHISLTWDGAMKRTSWWTGSPATAYDRGPCRVYAGQYAPLYGPAQYRPCPTGLPAAPSSRYPVYVYGQTATAIGVAQRALGMAADNSFGRQTRDVLLRWQTARGLPRTGVLDNATWSRIAPGVAPGPVPSPRSATPAAPSTVQTALTRYKSLRLSRGARGPAVAALQRALGVVGEPRFRARTEAAVRAVQKVARLRITGITDPRTWNRVEERAYPWVGYRRMVLRSGSRGPGVVALQRALRVSPDGAFGPITAAAVRAVQARYRLPVTGVTDARTWLAVIASASQ